MNRWLLVRRLRGPAFLLLFGVTALLNQWDVISFGRSWPLYLILLGVINLAERAALASAGPQVPPGTYPPPPPSTPSPSIVPTTSGQSSSEGGLS
jgi:Domain of unknown function (DUF5668)